jgi:flagellar biosynthesis protein FliP
VNVGSYVGVLLTLGFVLALLGVAAKLFRKFAPAALSGRSRLQMEVVQRLALSPRQGIAIVRVGDRVVAISTGDGGVHQLFELADTERHALLPASTSAAPAIMSGPIMANDDIPSFTDAWIDDEAIGAVRRNAIIDDDAEIPAFLTTPRTATISIAAPVSMAQPVTSMQTTSGTRDFSALLRGAMKHAGVPFAALLLTLLSSPLMAQVPATTPQATTPRPSPATAVPAIEVPQVQLPRIQSGAPRANAPTASPRTVAPRASAATRNASAPVSTGRPTAPNAAQVAPTATPRPATATAEQVVERLSPQLDLRVGGGDAEQKGLRLSGTVGVVVMMGLLTLLPMMLLMMTSFTRIFIVLSFLKQALGTQSAPPAQLVAGLALLLTGFVMAPTFSQMNREALQPWLDGRMEQAQMMDVGSKPFKAFMLKQTRPSDVRAFVRMSGQAAPARAEDLPLITLTSAFVTSELRTAFQIGFALFLPFIVIDIVVSAVLMSMGMMMLPPAMISLPFKLLLFVLVDGWSLVMQSLVASFR